jgi:hypothetical protein
MTCSNQAIPPAHVIGVKFSLNHIPHDLIHVVEFGAEDCGIMHLGVMMMVESLLCDC